MTTKIARIFVFGALMFGLDGRSVAQQKVSPTECSTAYENHNQIDYGPLKVAAVAGTSVVQLSAPLKGAPTEPGIPGACFVLFTEKDHKVVASAKADSTGRFRITNVAPGRYRLVARAEGFCTANIPLEVVTASRRRSNILVYFRVAGIDVCSTGELVPAENEK